MNYNFLIVFGENCPACMFFEQKHLNDLKHLIKNKYQDFLTYQETKVIMEPKYVNKELDNYNKQLKLLIKGFPCIFIYNNIKVNMYNMDDGIEPENIDKWIINIKNKSTKKLNYKDFTIIFLTAEECPACKNYVNTKKLEEHINYAKNKNINYKHFESVNLVINHLMRQISDEKNTDDKDKLEFAFKEYAKKLKIEQEEFKKIHKDLNNYTMFFPCVVIFKNSDLINKDKKLVGITCGIKNKDNKLSSDDRFNLNNFEEWVDYCVENFDIYLESIEVIDDLQVYFKTTKKIEDLKIYKDKPTTQKLNYFSRPMY